MLRFSDGVNVNTDGPLRVKLLRDGWYVVGDGMLLPCDSQQDAEQTLKDLSRVKER